MLLLRVAAAASRADAITKLVNVAVINLSHMSNCRVFLSLEARVTYCDKQNIPDLLTHFLMYCLLKGVSVTQSTLLGTVGKAICNELERICKDTI